jgi:hypothetical protein
MEYQLLLNKQCETSASARICTNAVAGIAQSIQ